MIFRRRAHPLPKFPPNVAPTFRQLCQELPNEEVSGSLKTALMQVMQKLEVDAGSSEKLDMELARAIAKGCMVLIEAYEGLDSKQKALAVGAIRYFAIADDPLSEKEFAVGFDDDARVLNYVFEELGINDQYIRIHR